MMVHYCGKPSAAGRGFDDCLYGSPVAPPAPCPRSKIRAAPPLGPLCAGLASIGLRVSSKGASSSRAFNGREADQQMRDRPVTERDRTKGMAPSPPERVLRLPSGSPIAWVPLPISCDVLPAREGRAQQAAVPSNSGNGITDDP